MSYQNLSYETDHNIAIITINRPQKMNALNKHTVEELETLLTDIQNNDDIGGILITGAGDKAFVAGADIGEIRELDSKSGRSFAEKGQQVFNIIENMHKPVIALVNGYALGGGCELAMACHLRIASEKAIFGQPEINLGIIPGYGGTQRLPRIIGKTRALEFLLTANMIDAEKAFNMGLANKVVAPQQLMEEGKFWLKRILAKAPLGIRAILESVQKGLQTDMAGGLEIEAELFGNICGSEDMREGTDAFLNKHDPHFKGK